VASDLVALCFGAQDPVALAGFWAGMLGREAAADATVPYDGFGLRFVPISEPKVGPNRIHLDLSSDSVAHQQELVARALDLGARHIDVGQRPEEGHVVLADPEGNELCVIEPDNRFLADCGPIGVINCDGSQAVGYFWSRALGWPLVWDEDEETAVQSPYGGTKIAWGGPPFAPKAGAGRLHLDLDSTGPDEVDRLLALGANAYQGWHGHAAGTVLADPDGNEFCLQQG
jgi:catechol 2,3-dioxygenase-like lactoylglutathione lyase family enzyme